MAEREADSGIELVLDNRKFIIAFVVLIAICGCFFVLGFIEGKRQGLQEGAQAAVVSPPVTSPDESQTTAAKPVDSGASATPAKEDAGEQQLSWYKNANRRDGEPEVTPKTSESGPAKKAAAPAPVSKPAVESAGKSAGVATARPAPQEKPAVAGPVTYSVQVGAFRVRREAENKAKALKAKGFDCRIEVPRSPDALYLLKVGKFSSRAEAVSMQLSLKKSGFNSFIKTN
jgi:cell division protein FtsN